MRIITCLIVASREYPLHLFAVYLHRQINIFHNTRSCSWQQYENNEFLRETSNSARTV